MKKQIVQRVAFFSFLGCLTIIGIAAHKNPHLKCEKEWKVGFVKKNLESKESIVVANSDDRY
jgi:hypothetical protein